MKCLLKMLNVNSLTFSSFLFICHLHYGFLLYICALWLWTIHIEEHVYQLIILWVCLICFCVRFSFPLTFMTMNILCFLRVLLTTGRNNTLMMLAWILLSFWMRESSLWHKCVYFVAHFLTFFLFYLPFAQIWMWERIKQMNHNK